MKNTVAASALAVVLSFASSVDAADAPAIKGNVVLSKVSPVAVLIWDASITLNELTAAHAQDADKMKTLESDAAKLMHDRAPALSADTVEMDIIYAKTNFGSQYGDPTLDQKETLVTMRAKKSDVAANGDAWSKALAIGAKTPHLTLNVTGKLPPP